MDAIDTNWCTVCERAIQTTNNLYCSEACRAKEERNARALRSSRLPSSQAPRPGQIHFELEDRQPEGYDSRKQQTIERWRQTVRPLAAGDAAGSPRELSYPSTPALSPRASSSSSLVAAHDFPPPSPAHLPLLHPGLSRMVSTDSESLCPPTTIGLTADDSPIATPPAQSEAGTPAVLIPTAPAVVSASPARFGRLHSLTARLISSPSPASVSASYEEAGRRSFEKREQPTRAVAIDIPVRQSPNMGYHRYRPKDEQPRHRVFRDDDDDDSSFSPPRRQPVVVRFSTQPE